MLDTPPVPHRCRRAGRCPDRERLDDGRVLGALIPTEDGLCPSCVRHAEWSIEELPADYVALDLVLGKTSSVAGQFVTGTRDLPVPLRLNIEALQAEMVHELSCWAESVAEVMRITWDTQATARARPGARVQRATNLLSGAVSVLLALRDVTHLGWQDGQRGSVDRDGFDGAIILTDLHYRTRSYTGQTRLTYRSHVPCLRCGRVALEQANGDDKIGCTACGTRWQREKFDKLCDAFAERFEAAA